MKNVSSIERVKPFFFCDFEALEELGRSFTEVVRRTFSGYDPQKLGKTWGTWTLQVVFFEILGETRGRNACDLNLLWWTRPDRSFHADVISLIQMHLMWCYCFYFPGNRCGVYYFEWLNNKQRCIRSTLHIIFIHRVLSMYTLPCWGLNNGTHFVTWERISANTWNIWNFCEI